MPASKAQQASVYRYMKKNYDMFQIRMPKGELDGIRTHAAARHESVNGFIRRAIAAQMERDALQSPVTNEPAAPPQDTVPE